MPVMGSRKSGYLLAALFGAAAGGIFVTIVTKAVPKMVSQVTSEMMRGMISKMKEAGFNPAET